MGYEFWWNKESIVRRFLKWIYFGNMKFGRVRVYEGGLKKKR